MREISWSRDHRIDEIDAREDDICKSEDQSWESHHSDLIESIAHDECSERQRSEEKWWMHDRTIITSHDIGDKERECEVESDRYSGVYICYFECIGIDHQNTTQYDREEEEESISQSQRQYTCSDEEEYAHALCENNLRHLDDTYSDTHWTHPEQDQYPESDDRDRSEEDRSRPENNNTQNTKYRCSRHEEEVYTRSSIYPKSEQSEDEWESSKKREKCETHYGLEWKVYDHQKESDNPKWYDDKGWSCECRDEEDDIGTDAYGKWGECRPIGNYRKSTRREGESDKENYQFSHTGIDTHDTQQDGHTYSSDSLEIADILSDWLFRIERIDQSNRDCEDRRIDRQEDRTRCIRSYEKWSQVGKNKCKSEKDSRSIYEWEDDGESGIQEDKYRGDRIRKERDTGSDGRTEEVSPWEDGKEIHSDTDTEEDPRLDNNFFFIEIESCSDEEKSEEEADTNLPNGTDLIEYQIEKKEGSEKEEDPSYLRKWSFWEEIPDPEFQTRWFVFRFDMFL